MRFTKLVIVAALALAQAAAAAAAPAPVVANATGALEAKSLSRVDVHGDGAIDVTVGAGPAVSAATQGRGPVASVHAQRVAGHGVVAVRWQSGLVVALEYAGGVLKPLFERPPSEGGQAYYLMNAQELLTWQTAPTVWRCGGDDVPVLAEKWDFARGQLVAAPAPSGPAGPASKLSGRTGVAPPSLRATGPLGGYHFEVASSQIATRDDLEAPPAPVELSDGNPATVFRQSKHGGVLSARAPDARFAIVALRLVPAPSNQDTKIGSGRISPPAKPARPTAKSGGVGPGHPGEPLPRRLVVSFEDHSKFDVDLPASAQDSVWVELPAPVHSRCLSVELEGPQAFALGELEVWSELDLASGAGIDQLVGDVAKSGLAGHEAVRRLKTVGADAAARVEAAFVGAEGAARVRLALALVELTSTVEAADYLVRALPEATGDQRGELATALGELGIGATPALARLLGDAGQPDDLRITAARLLGAIPDRGAAQTLVSALLGQASPALARALARAAAESRALDMPELLSGTWAAGSPGLAEEARLAQAARGQVTREGQASVELGDQVLARLGATLSAGDAAYPLRFHLIRAAGGLWEHGSTAAGSALAAVLAQDQDPVLREAALQDLLRRATPGADAAVLAAARDRDPAVRALAATGLGRQAAGPAHAEVRRLLDKDGWTFVREDAASALADTCRRGRPDPADMAALVASGKTDGTDHVRVTALRGLVGCGVPEAAATLVAIARDPREESDMRVEVVGLMGLVHDPGMGPALLAILADAASNSAYSDGATQQAIAAADALGRLCPAGADAALAELAKDADPGLAQAGSHALARCRAHAR